jgi:DNA replication protein DnaC
LGEAYPRPKSRGLTHNHQLGFQLTDAAGGPLVLIVDDVAMREHTPTQSDDLYDLVSDRAITAKPLILTSNRAPKDWYPLFPTPSSPSHCSTASSTPATKS